MVQQEPIEMGSDQLFSVYKGNSAIQNRYCSYIIKCNNEDINLSLESYMNSSIWHIVDIIRQEVENKKLVKVSYSIRVVYRKNKKMVDGSFIEMVKLLKAKSVTFTSSVEDEIRGKLQQFIIPQIREQNENVILSGSNWRLANIVWLEVAFNTFDITKSFICGTYIPLPKKLQNTKSVINVKNTEDDNCFMYSIFSNFFKNDRNTRHLPSTYENVDATIAYIDRTFGVKLDFSGISFPVSLHDIYKFKKRNPTIPIDKSIQVSSRKWLYPIYISF